MKIAHGVTQDLDEYSTAHHQYCAPSGRLCVLDFLRTVSG
nr:hypothetical protein [Kibdelosporangium sp. MJ126-NF4]